MIKSAANYIISNVHKFFSTEIILVHLFDKKRFYLLLNVPYLKYNNTFYYQHHHLKQITLKQYQ